MTRALVPDLSASHHVCGWGVWGLLCGVQQLSRWSGEGSVGPVLGRSLGACAALGGEWTMGNLGKGSRVVPEQPLWLSLGSWWHPPAGQPGAASRLSTGLVRRPFQGKILFLVQLPPRPLELLTILFSICKSLNAETCHPESDSVGWWSLSRQGLGPVPALQQSRRPPRGSPGSWKRSSSPTSPSCRRAGRS